MSYTSGVGNLNQTIDYTKLLNNIQYQQTAAQLQTTATNPAYNTQSDVYVSQKTSTETCTDGKDDGKIGFWSAVGNTLKGVGKTIVNGVKGMFTNKDGKFSLGKTLLSIGTAALCIAFPAVGLVACGVGAVMGAVQVGKGVYNAATAETDAEAKQAWQNIGGGAFTVATSVIGAKASLGAVKATSSAGGAKGLSALDKLDDTATIGQKAGALIKDMGSSTVNRGKTIGQTASALSKQHNMNKTAKQANKAQTQAQKAQDSGAKNADTLQNKANKAQTKAETAQKTFDDYLNSHETAKANVEKINGKIESGKKLLETKKQQATEAIDGKRSEITAKANSLKNSKQKATTPENQNSPQAELYKTADKTKLSSSDKAQRGQSQIDKFNKRAAKADPNRATNSTTKAGQKAQAQQKSVVQETQTAAATTQNSTKTSRIGSLINGAKDLPAKLRSGLSNKGQQAWEILTKDGYSQAIKELGYDAVYEVLAVVEGYSLVDQSV